MQFMSLLLDGDAKTYRHLSTLDVPRDCISITKEEYVNRVAKRQSTGFCSKISKSRNKGIVIGGQKDESLKENAIIRLTNFNRKTIKFKSSGVQHMKTAIIISLFHSSPTVEAPKYNKYPTRFRHYGVFIRVHWLTIMS
ncbi:uncharacterized protein NPIL_696291 [Nephila pilipes]|uniref:Uncharacterized protein n=1 Tax=Nephila pilipes TaxID=299642 RepID=A0A8X6IUW0_NEPPI|nr:uncharacterized protein NPIL_696291 [Nephila pilipes]